MPEIAIRLYGHPPTFDPKSGPLVGLVEVEVEGGTTGCLVDRERGRARLDSIPGSEADKWTSPSGVLLIGRRGWWGCTIRLDKVPHPPPPDLSAVEVDRAGGGFKRPYLPRDLASCPRCGLTVVVSRARKGEAIRLATPTRRLAARAEQVLRSAGLFAFASECKGRGRKAGRDHAADCYGLPWFKPFKEPTRRRGPGRPRVVKPPKVPLPPECRGFQRKPKGPRKEVR